MTETAVAPNPARAVGPYRRALADALELAIPVDAVAAEERAASLAKRSLKKDSKVWGLKLAISMMDLTTLEGKDTRGKVFALCQKAIRPDPSDPEVPPVAASAAVDSISIKHFFIFNIGHAGRASKAAVKLVSGVVQPTIPPCARIMSSVAALKRGK